VNDCQWQSEPTTAPPAGGQYPVIPTTLNLSNQAVSEVFALFEKPHFFGFDHILATFYASNAVVARVCAVFEFNFCFTTLLFYLFCVTMYLIK